MTVPQYSLLALVGVWAASALPMAALAWLVAPRLARALSGPAPLGQALLICLTAGLVWQFVLVLGLVTVEQRSLRWTVLSQALWLKPPRSPRTGRVGGRTWLVLLPLMAAFYAVHAVRLLPQLPYPAGRDLGSLLASHAGAQLLHGGWGWFSLSVTMFAFNTALGEELLFRGFLLPRMNGAFGKGDWAANGVLFAVYHLHEWWAIPTILLDALVLAYPAKRYRSAYIGMAVHGAQSVFFTVALLGLVL